MAQGINVANAMSNRWALTGNKSGDAGYWQARSCYLNLYPQSDLLKQGGLEYKTSCYFHTAVSYSVVTPVPALLHVTAPRPLRCWATGYVGIAPGATTRHLTVCQHRQSTLGYPDVADYHSLPFCYGYYQKDYTSLACLPGSSYLYPQWMINYPALYQQSVTYPLYDTRYVIQSAMTPVLFIEPAYGAVPLPEMDIKTPYQGKSMAKPLPSNGQKGAVLTDCEIIPIKLSNPVMSMTSWAERQGEMTRHSRSYGEELQRRIFVQIVSAIGDFESAIGITQLPPVVAKESVGAGGHADALILLDNDIAKLTSTTELQIYQDRANNRLDAIIPRHRLEKQLTEDELSKIQPLKTARRKGQDIIIMEKAGGNIPRQHKRELDIKIGAATASRHQLITAGYSSVAARNKKARHKVLDRITGSHDRGYRLEGAKLHGERLVTHRLSLSRNTGKNLKKMLDLPKDTLQANTSKIIEQLIKIRAAMTNDHVTFIASSVLILIDDQNPENTTVKLIDLAHPVINNKNKQFVKSRQRFLDGISHLIRDLEHLMVH